MLGSYKEIEKYYYYYFIIIIIISTTYITCPADPQKTLGIKLPFLVMIIKNMKKYFSFEVQVYTCTCTRDAILNLSPPTPPGS